ncbi:MAG: sigma-54-dependent Fis family transcriptional regulator [Deltaproteobacteria bacterium]|nr:sigma-54-dependent Fis family transcriptional regulator [Deltaproteobacteria bacterium]
MGLPQYDPETVVESVTEEHRIAKLTEELVPFVGIGRWAKETWGTVQAAARSGDRLTLVGEAGTGKTLLARHLHWQSPTADAPYQIIQLERIPHEVVESELFGYVRGGFLSRRTVVPGRVAACGTGTCIVTGLDRLPSALQERCLSWLCEGAMIPMGSEERIPAPARIVFELRAREFPRARESALIGPLYDLVARHVVTMEPIARRRDDIVPLVEYYLERYGTEWGLGYRRLSSEAARFLRRAGWRENVRGIMLAAAHAVSTTEARELTPKDFPPQLARHPELATELGLESTSLEELIERKLTQFFERLGEYDVHELHSAITAKVERPLIKLVLAKTRGNQVQAARILGINRNTLRTRMRQLGLTAKRERA